MGSSYRSGLRTAVRRWQLALILFAANCVPGLAFGAGAWSWLATALDKSLATRTLLTDLDVNVFIDLQAHHSESLWMLILGGMLLAMISWAFGVWVNAVTIAAVGDDVPLATAAHRGLDLYARFLALDLLALTVDAVLVVATVLVGRWLAHWVADSPSEMALYVILGGAAAAAAVALLFLTAVHDHARIHSAATGAGAAGAYVWALRFVAAHERRALPLAATLVGTGGAGWLVYQTASLPLATNWMPGVILALAWSELFAVSRMFLRVWSFASQTELQHLSEATSA